MSPAQTAFAERVWFAWHCLPRNAADRPPSWRSLEREHKLPDGVFSGVVSGQRRTVEMATMVKLAAALQTTLMWLLSADGNGPIVTTPVPPMPTGKPAPPRRSVGAYLRRFDFEPARVEAALAALFDVTPP